MYPVSQLLGEADAQRSRPGSLDSSRGWDLMATAFIVPRVWELSRSPEQKLNKILAGLWSAFPTMTRVHRTWACGSQEAVAAGLPDLTCYPIFLFFKTSLLV